MSGVELDWQEPPSSHQGIGRRSKHWADVAHALRENPGRWALVQPRADGTLGTRIKTGVLAAFRPAGSFQTALRKVDDNKYNTFARYVGESDGA